MIKKHPLIIGIGGSGSGAGKTRIAEALLRHFNSKVQRPKTSNQKDVCVSAVLRSGAVGGWGAIKYTRTEIYSSIIDDYKTLTVKDKDTARLLAAGAVKVLWVQSPADELGKVMPVAISRFGGFEGIIVEGNSAIEFLKPDVVIFISGRDKRELKKSAVKILNIADIILFEEESSIKSGGKAKKFKVDFSQVSGLDEFMNYMDKLLR